MLSRSKLRKMFKWEIKKKHHCHKSQSRRCEVGCDTALNCLHRETVILSTPVIISTFHALFTDIGKLNPLPDDTVRHSKPGSHFRFNTPKYRPDLQSLRRGKLQLVSHCIAAFRTVLFSKISVGMMKITRRGSKVSPHTSGMDVFVLL